MSDDEPQDEMHAELRVLLVERAEMTRQKMMTTGPHQIRKRSEQAKNQSAVLAGVFEEIFISAWQGGRQSVLSMLEDGEPS